jgi:anti-sigma factor ChrR (cupin superfamily)
VDHGTIILRGLYRGEAIEESRWEPFRPGIEIIRLYETGPAGPAAALLRYQPGAQLPPHAHTGHEHILVLQGSQRDENGEYGPGDCLINPPGSSHSVSSPNGCVVLAIWASPVKFLEQT